MKIKNSYWVWQELEKNNQLQNKKWITVEDILEELQPYADEYINVQSFIDSLKSGVEILERDEE